MVNTVNSELLYLTNYSPVHPLDNNETLAKIIKTTPVSRLGQPKNIAHSVLLLVSDSTGFIAGSTLSIYGGQHMH